MKAGPILKMASVIMLLHAVGHTMGALTWKNAANPAVKQVIDGMLRNRFDFMGHTASIGDFYAGYGYSMIGVLLLLSILLWILSSEPSKRIIGALGLFLVFLSVVEYIYFFPFAAAFSLVAGIVTLIPTIRMFNL